MRSFTVHYKRRHATGVYTATVLAFSDKDAREAAAEFERSRGFYLTRFTDEPEVKTREE